MRLQNLTKATFAECAKSVNTIILPVGAIEPHGDHLPLGTDIYIPQGLVDRIEAQLGEKVIIAPGVNYGHVWTMDSYPGAVNVSTETLVAYLVDIGQSFLDDGIMNIVFLNGHGGNIPAVTTASEKLAEKGATVITFNWWMNFKEEILEICEGQGHGGEDEASAVLAVAEEYCNMDLAGKNENKLIADIKKKDIGQISFENAMSGDATLASREKGEKILDRIGEKIVEIITKVEKEDILQ